MTESKAPADRKPKTVSAADQKKQREAVAKFLSTGLDFTPFTVDAGDGVEWAFKPDLMPADVARLRSAVTSIHDASEGDSVDALQASFDETMDAVRALLIEDGQREEFPRPLYGINAALFFAMTLIGGKTGFPTE